MADPVTPSGTQPSQMSAADRAVVQKTTQMIALVRAQMRDYPELNRLTDGKENSDRAIAMALFMAIDDYNMSPPLLPKVLIGTHPSPSLLVEGTVIQLLKSQGLLQTRNQLSYSDGQGVTVSVSDKGPALMNWLNLFMSSYEQKKRQLKQAINLNAALGVAGGVSSEFLVVNTWFENFGI